MTTVLRTVSGETLPFDPSLYRGDATPAELRLLERATGPVLDVGCGPGRLCVALGHRCVPAAGVEPAASAAAAARSRGVAVLERSVFDRIPGAGRWVTILLVDGNIGIAGAPEVLLQRVRSLLHPEGRVLVEVDRPGTGDRRMQVRLERAGAASPWFPWARVDEASLVSVAAAVGLSLTQSWTDDERHFAVLEVRR